MTAALTLRRCCRLTASRPWCSCSSWWRPIASARSTLTQRARKGMGLGTWEGSIHGCGHYLTASSPCTSWLVLCPSGVACRHVLAGAIGERFLYDCGAGVLAYPTPLPDFSPTERPASHDPMTATSEPASSFQEGSVRVLSSSPSACYRCRWSRSASAWPSHPCHVSR